MNEGRLKKGRGGWSDLAVTVNVSLADHFINLLVGELLAQVGHNVAELSRRDEAVAVLPTTDNHGVSIRGRDSAQHILQICVCVCVQGRGGVGSLWRFPSADLVENLEGLEDLLLGVGVLHLARHQSQELGEIDGPVSVGVDLRASHSEGSDSGRNQVDGHVLAAPPSATCTYARDGSSSLDLHGD
jgi:hypothetical protein